MKMKFLAGLSAFLILTLTGCGSDNNDGPPVFFSSILSVSDYDGDIQKNLSTGELLNITHAVNTQNVLAGIGPNSEDEFRAFLYFPLTGVGGVPGDAIIESAFLDIVINDIVPQPLNGSIPVRIDLVSFPPPLVLTDFDRTLQPALATTTLIPPISSADFGQHVGIDVTPLMIEAQRLGLLDFQVRIMADLGYVSPGLIEINDVTGSLRSTLAPLLTVSYF
ncbi:MAG: hypothetical protein U1D97_15610 [Desulfuromonadales bacterium]|nr:hypothetical protein [Desulfuromonadales bacterium]